jgi:WD40 repeat protein
MFFVPRSFRVVTGWLALTTLAPLVVGCGSSSNSTGSGGRGGGAAGGTGGSTSGQGGGGAGGMAGEASGAAGSAGGLGGQGGQGGSAGAAAGSGGTSGGGGGTSGTGTGGATGGARGGTGGGSAATGTGGSGGGGSGGTAPLPPFAPCGVLGITAIRASTYLPDGHVVLGLAGGVAKLIDPMDGRELRTFMGHAGGVNALAVSADGATLATASDDHTVRLWRISDGATLAVLAGHGRELYSVAISPDGTRVAAGAGDGELFLWRPDGTLIASNLDHLDAVLGVGFAAGGTRLYSSSRDKSLRVFAPADLTPLTPAVTKGVAMGPLAVSPDGTRIAVGETAKNVSLWRAADGTLERRFTTMYGVPSVAFSPDGARVYAVVASTTYGFPVDGSAPLTYQAGQDSTVAASPDGQAVFVTDKYGLYLSSATTTNLIHDPLPIGPIAVGLSFVPDGSRLFVAGSWGLVSYALPANTIDHVVQRELYGAYYGAVAVSPDGKQFATAESQGSDNVVTLWSASTYQRGIEIVRSQNVFPTRVTYSPDGVLVGIAGNQGSVYRTSTGAQASWLSVAGDVGSIGFSPDGTLAAVAGFYVSVARTSDWMEVLHVDQAHTVFTPDLSFSPDSKSVATAGDERVTVWSTTPGIPRRDLVRQSGLYAMTVAYAPTGNILAAGGSDGPIRLWTASDLTPLPNLPSHGPGVVFARFSPDGTKLAAAYDDGTVWMWCKR